MSDEELHDLLTEDGRLARIEAKLNRIETKLAAFEQAIMPVLANPGKILARIMTGGR